MLIELTSLCRPRSQGLAVGIRQETQQTGRLFRWPPYSKGVRCFQNGLESFINSCRGGQYLTTLLFVVP